MKKSKCLLVVFLFLAGSSCTKFLDTKPEDFLSPEYYYNNENQVNTALAGIYNKLSDTREGAPLYSSAYFTFMGTEGDDGFYRKGPERNVPGQFLYNASAPHIANLWRVLYEGVNLANVMLEKLDGADMDNAKREIVRGETLFLRAYYYFLLVSNFGDVPLTLQSTVTPDFNGIERTTAKTVYAQITKDMEQAYDLVPTATVVGYGGRVNKSAVAGILARVYLYWAGEPIKDISKYQNARDWAYEVIRYGEHALNPSFEQVFINYAADKYDVKESIWEVEFYGNRTDRPRQAGMVGNYIGIVSSNDSIGRSNGNVWASGRLYQLYQPGDLRRDWTIAPYLYSPATSTNKSFYGATDIWTRYAGKYRREYETFLPKSVGYTPINFPLLRYSDVLLMFAEAENQIHGAPTPDAISAVNQVRQRAYGSSLYGNRLQTITVVNRGSGYTSAPVVNIAGGNPAVPATATATISGGRVTTVTITNPGSFYKTTPEVQISFTGGGGTGATATAIITSPGDADLTSDDISDQLSFLLAIQDERSRELAFECLRKYDLVRWGIYVSSMKAMANSYLSSSASSQAKNVATALGSIDSRHLLFPIPTHEMSLNRKLVQNPGW